MTGITVQDSIVNVSVQSNSVNISIQPRTVNVHVDTPASTDIIIPEKIVAPAGGVIRFYDTDGVTVIAEISKDAVRWLGQVEQL